MEAQPCERWFTRTLGHLTPCTSTIKGFVSKKPTFTRLVSPFFFKLEEWKSPSHLLTHHQLDKKKGENRTQRATRGLEKMIERPCFKKTKTKGRTRRNKAYQQPIPTLWRLARHCATPLQQPGVHWCTQTLERLARCGNLMQIPQRFANAAAKGWASAAASEIKGRGRASRDRVGTAEWWERVRGYLEAPYDLWSVTLEIGRRGRSNNPGRTPRFLLRRVA